MHETVLRCGCEVIQEAAEKPREVVTGTRRPQKCMESEI